MTARAKSQKITNSEHDKQSDNRILEIEKKQSYQNGVSLKSDEYCIQRKIECNGHFDEIKKDIKLIKRLGLGIIIAVMFVNIDKLPELINTVKNLFGILP